MNGLQEWREWREWRESVDRALADVLRRVEALERRTELEELIKVGMNAQMPAITASIDFADIDPVPQMYNARYEPTGDAPTIVESSP